MTRTRETLSILTVLLFACGMAVAASRPNPPKERVNIIVIMADDLGYECIGANGCEDYKTPVLDGLAAEGMRFTQCFSNPICTPSRVKIMTGLYNVRNYKAFGLLPQGEKTFAHMLKDAGYATCIAGKWQLQGGPQGPKDFGFDQSLVWHNGRGNKRKDGPHKGQDNRFTNPQLELNGEHADYTNGEFSTDLLVDFIGDFMQTNKEKPFFVYYPMILTHCPFVPTPGAPDYDSSSMGSPTYKGDAKYFGDMVNHMDKAVGGIVAKLDDLGIRNNTLLIFTGDNGTDKPVVTRCGGRDVIGGKGQVDDTGTRVPFIVSWPGMVGPTVNETELVEHCDILPTLSEVSGAPLPADYPGDGVSLLPILSGKGKRTKKNIYIWYRGKTWARTVDYGVMLDNEKGTYQYQKFSGHYEMEKVDPNAVGEKANTTLRKLQRVIEDLAKTRRVEDKTSGKKKQNAKKAKK